MAELGGIVGSSTKKLTKIALTDDEGMFLEFEATISTQHQGDAVVTEHPVEQGADVTDHIRRSPETLEINGVVSNTPLVVLGRLNAERTSVVLDRARADAVALSVPGGDVRTRAEDAYNFLKGIKDQGRTVKVITTLRIYKNMAIRGIVVSRDKDTRNILDVRLSLKEIVIALTGEADVPKPVNTSRDGRSNIGKKSKKEEPDTSAASEKSKTILELGFTFAGKVAGF